MSPRAQATAPADPDGPVAVVGVVRITGPNGRGYYRLKWRKPDGTERDTSGSARLRASSRSEIPAS